MCYRVLSAGRRGAGALGLFRRVLACMGFCNFRRGLGGSS